MIPIQGKLDSFLLAALIAGPLAWPLLTLTDPGYATACLYCTSSSADLQHYYAPSLHAKQ